MVNEDKNKESRGQVIPLFVTVDPARDSAQVLKNYLKDFHPKLIGLTGTTEQVLSVAKAFRVYFAPASIGEEKEYLVDHSAFIYLMGPDGKFLDLFGSDKDSEGIYLSILAHLKSNK